MKNNIDLTANSDFSNSSIRTGRLFRIGKRSYPWDFEGSNLASYYDLFSVGTIRDIKTQRNYEKEYEFHCDRCGKDLSLKPWDKQYCLCSRCAGELESNIQLDHFPYKERYSVYQDYLNTTSDRVVLELNYR